MSCLRWNVCPLNLWIWWTLLKYIISYKRRLEKKLRRDARRVQIMRMLRLNKDPAGSYEFVAEIVVEFESEVVSGMMQGSREYFTLIAVGTPTKEQFMVLYTGSDVAWIQCMPCSECYSHVNTIFNLDFSASFSPVRCNSSVCGQISAYNCHNGCYIYNVS